MKNPLYNREHRREYLLFGGIAAALYMIFVVIFLIDNTYENSYLLYFGNIAFSIVIAIHAFLQVNKRYEGNSSPRMMITGHLSALAGVVMAAIMVALAVFIFYPNMGRDMNSDTLMQGAHTTNKLRTPGAMLLMLLINATIPNFAIGSFFSVLIAYVCKRDQTKDRTAELDRNIKVVK